MAIMTTRPAAAGHRARLTEGLAAAIAEKGYAAVTIADVVRIARVSKRTFYEHFADKEACFLALYAETSEELLELIATATAVARGPWEARIGAAARAYFERVAGEPELMRAALLEIQAAGPRARVLRREVQRRYAEQLRGFSEAAEAEERGITALTPALATAVVGGLDELMLEAVEAGHAERMGELADAATELIRAVRSADSCLERR
jgi:AcrR family transcriptional regulator